MIKGILERKIGITQVELNGVNLVSWLFFIFL